MDHPKRHLEKMLPKESGLAAFEATGEDLGLLVETLHEIQQCRTGRQFLLEKFRLDLIVSPAGFHQLLAIPEIDRVETTNKMGEIDQISRREKRALEDPVAAADLNVVLQELNRDLVRLRDLKTEEFPELLLAEEMTAELLPATAAAVASLRALNPTSMGYLFSPFKTKRIEKTFLGLFPKTAAAHPLRENLGRIERELGFFRQCADLSQKWSPLGLDLFYIFRQSGLSQAVENIQRLGSCLWNVVYNGQRLSTSIKLVGINFGDVRSLFEEGQPQ